jgi:hypothetical protein
MAKMITKKIDDKTYYIVEAPSKDEVVAMWVVAVMLGYLALKMLDQLKQFTMIF